MKINALVLITLVGALATLPMHATGSDAKDDTTAAATESAQHNAEAGESLYKSNCKSCHGTKGRGMASYPKLSDKTADYIVKRLNQYKSGEKIGPNTPLMRPQAAKLTDEEIANLAAYLSTVAK